MTFGSRPAPRAERDAWVTATLYVQSGLLLTVLVLTVLRVLRTIEWSWWWIFAPIWVPVGLFLGAVILLLFAAAGIDIVLNEPPPEAQDEPRHLRRA